MRIHPFKAYRPNIKDLASRTEFFKTVKARFPEYFANDLYSQFNKEGFYIYRISKGSKAHTGIVCSVDIHDFLEGKILKHENILTPKAIETKERILLREAQLKPVLLTFPGGTKLRKWFVEHTEGKKSSYKIMFQDGDWTHRIWHIADPKLIKRIQEYFKEHIPKAYIADGHHRTETMAALYDRNSRYHKHLDFSKLLVAFFPFEELEIHDYNRIVEIKNRVTPTMLMARLSNYARIIPLRKARKPDRKGQMTMMVNSEWYGIKWKKKTLKRFADQHVWLDVQIFNEMILEEIFDIRDLHSDMSVKYVAGVSGVQMIHEKTATRDIRIAFCIYPVQMEEFKKVSDESGVLPPKSTWFEPRLKNGFIVQGLRREEIE